MATHSQFFYSTHQPTAAGTGKAASTNYRSETKFIQPFSHSPDFKSHHSTTRSTVLKFSPSQIDRITQEFAHSLIAWVVGKDIRPWTLARLLHRYLRLTKLPHVSDVGHGYFVLKFSEADFLALQDNPWPIPNLSIYVFSWVPDFKPSEATHYSIDAWIRLHELSIEYYDEEILREIAETIGQALVKIDPVTKERKNCKYARICVRINLYEPLPSTIRLGTIRQEIEYEGFDLLCRHCGCVVHLKHDCLNSSGSRFEPHDRGDRSFEEIWSMSSSTSKPPLISPETSVAWGSRYEVLGTESKAPLQDLNDLPSPSMGSSEKAATRTKTSSVLPQLPGLLAEPIENQKDRCGVSVEILPNSPKESALQGDLPQSHPISISSNLEEAWFSTISASVLEQNHLDLSMALAPLLVDQFTAIETSCSTTIEVHNNQPQPSSSPATISTPQRTPTSKPVHTFCSSGIERSILKKKITSTSQGFSINRRPILYSIDESVTSFEIGLSDSPDSAPKQNQFVISFVSAPRSGSKAISVLDTKKMLGWNFRGVDNANLIEGLKYMVQKYEAPIVVIFGTRITDDVVEEVVDGLGFHGSYCKKFDDYHGGVWLFIFRHDVQTEVFEVNSYSTKGVSASTYFQLEISEPMASLSYADNETSAQTCGPASFCASTFSPANALTY